MQPHLKGNTRHQSGATLLGMLIIAILVVFAATVVMKMVPPYTEYLSVKKVLAAMKQESLSNMTNKEIRDAFDKRANTSYIETVTGKDLTVEKTPSGEVTLSVDYQVIKPIMGNVSILMDFSATTAK